MLHTQTKCQTWEKKKRQLAQCMRRKCKRNDPPLTMHLSNMCRGHLVLAFIAHTTRCTFMSFMAVATLTIYRRFGESHGRFHPKRKCSLEQSDAQTTFPHPYTTNNNSYWKLCWYLHRSLCNSHVQIDEHLIRLRFAAVLFECVSYGHSILLLAPHGSAIVNHWYVCVATSAMEKKGKN